MNSSNVNSNNNIPVKQVIPQQRQVNSFIIAPKKSYLPILIEILLFIILAVVFIFIVINLRQSSTPVPEASTEISGEVPNTQVEASPDQTINFTVRNAYLKRPDGKDSQFTFTVPIEVVLNRESITDSTLENPDFKYSMTADTYKISISQQYNISPVAYDASLIDIGTVNKVGTIYRYYIPQVGFGYVSDVQTSNCVTSTGETLKAPCGEPELKYTDDNFSSNLTFVCNSGDSTICDSIILSLKISAVTPVAEN